MEICNIYSEIEMCKVYGEKSVNVNSHMTAVRKYVHRPTAPTARYVYHLFKTNEEGWLFNADMIGMYITPIEFWQTEHGLEDACSYNDDSEVMMWLEEHRFGEDMECVFSSLRYSSMETAREEIEESGLFMFDKTFYDYMAHEDGEDDYESLRDE